MTIQKYNEIKNRINNMRSTTDLYSSFEQLVNGTMKTIQETNKAVEISKQIINKSF